MCSTSARAACFTQLLQKQTTWSDCSRYRPRLGTVPRGPQQMGNCPGLHSARCRSCPGTPSGGTVVTVAAGALHSLCQSAQGLGRTGGVPGAPMPGPSASLGGTQQLQRREHSDRRLACAGSRTACWRAAARAAWGREWRWCPATGWWAAMHHALAGAGTGPCQAHRWLLCWAPCWPTSLAELQAGVRWRAA